MPVGCSSFINYRKKCIKGKFTCFWINTASKRWSKYLSVTADQTCPSKLLDKHLLDTSNDCCYVAHFMRKGLEVLGEHITHQLWINIYPCAYHLYVSKTFHREQPKRAKMCHFFNITHLSCEHLVWKLSFRSTGTQSFHEYKSHQYRESLGKL
jgi:hypothetical protein